VIRAHVAQAFLPDVPQNFILRVADLFDAPSSRTPADWKIGDTAD